MLYMTVAQLAYARALFAKQASTTPDPAAPSMSVMLECLNGLHGGKYSTKLASKDGAGNYVPAAEQPTFTVPAYTYQYGVSPDGWGARIVGDAIGALSFAALVDSVNGSKWLGDAYAWASAAAQYPLWGQSLCGANNPAEWGPCITQKGLNPSLVNGKVVQVFEYSDLAEGQLLFGMALAYDWLPRVATPTPAQLATLQLMRNALAVHGQQTYCRATLPGTQTDDQWMCNHLWINVVGMLAAGYALQEDATYGTQAKLWIALAKTNFGNALSHLWTDGTWHEGPLYGDYAVSWGYRFLDLVETAEGTNFLAQFANAQKWFAKYSTYRAMTTIPYFPTTGTGAIFPNFPIPATEGTADGSATTINPVYTVDLADSFRAENTPLTGILRRLARDHKDALAQDIATRIPQGTRRVDYWLDCLWYTPLTASSTMPTSVAFSDMGVTVDRATNNGDVSILTFSAGPPLSKFWQKTSPTVDPGSGHAHPCAGSFSISFTSAKALAGAFPIRNPGYSVKASQIENTLTVDTGSVSMGQYGESRAWLEWTNQYAAPAYLSHPELASNASSTATVQMRSGNLTNAYPPSLGIAQFVRTLAFFKSLNVLLVFDTIAPTAKMPTGTQFSLRFHSDYLPLIQSDGSFGWTTPLSNTPYKTPVLPLSFNIRRLFSSAGSTIQAIKETYPAAPSLNLSLTIQMPVVIISRATALGDWRNITAMTWGTSTLPTIVMGTSASGQQVVVIGGTAYTFQDQTDGTVTIID